MNTTTISLLLVGGTLAAFGGMVVTVDGVSYERMKQYRDVRTWTSDKGLEMWSGVSVRNPALSMVGGLSGGSERGGRRFYVEKMYRAGKLASTITSVCHWSQAE
jgi:hypothetical protein